MKNAFEVSHNAVMQEFIRTSEKIASSDLNVVIIGEHGTGKEWLARAIHGLSVRSKEPFYPVDCAALQPEELERELFGYENISHDGVAIRRGAFEEAGSGTLFLNEIGSLPSAVQMKVGRALEFRDTHRVGSDHPIRVEARVIASLSQPASPLIERGLLHKDLFYRISSIVLDLPPLRQRREDIPLLAEKFLRELYDRRPVAVRGFTADALALLTNFDWPGNVRHLKNAIEYAFTMCSGDWIQSGDLPGYLHRKPPAQRRTKER